MSDFEISVEPAAAGKAFVKVNLPNGHKYNSEDCEPREAGILANGIRQGFMLALNAIGFVPMVNNKMRSN